MTAPKTIFLDVDGCILNHVGSLTTILDWNEDQEVLPGVHDKINEWERKGYNIILTTGRKESMRKLTEDKLTKSGIFWDQLIMGLGGGPRVLINDMKGETKTALAINIERNKGLEVIEI